MEAHAGSYFSEELQATYTMADAGGELVVHRRRADPQRLRPTTRGEFAAGPATVRLARRAGAAGCRGPDRCAAEVRGGDGGASPAGPIRTDWFSR